MALLRSGLQLPSFTFPGIPESELFERVGAIAQAAESSGFDALFVMDHFYQIDMIGPADEPMLEAYTLLGAIAARTRRLQLGTLVTGVTYRNPALLAKIVTTLDIVSSGRAILGIGAAWNEQEHRGLGFDFPAVGERMARLEEALRICRAMFAGQRPSFDGRHYRTHEALNSPRPVRGDVPILVGGSGERRTLRLVARYGDACNLFGDPGTLKAKLGVLDRHCEEVGRDPGEITKTCLATLVVAESEADVRRSMQDLAATRDIALDQLAPMVVHGSPEHAAEQLAARMDAGLDGIVVNIPAVSPELVELAGATFARLG